MDEIKKEIVVEEDGTMDVNAKKGELDESNEYVVIFKKPFKFEGKEYKGVDLSKIEDLSTNQLKEAEKRFSSGGNFSVISEMTVSFACIIAEMVTNQPMEFFENLPANEGIKLKNLLTGYFYS